MVDFYSALARKIQEAQDDPARMREVVYEAARLALRWQVAERGSLSNLGDSRRLKTELEEAIARLEAEAAAASAGTAAAPAVPEELAAAPLADDAEKPGAAGPEQPPQEASAAAEPTIAAEPSAAVEPEESLAATSEPAAAAAALDQLVHADLGAIRPGAPIDLDEAAAAKGHPAQPSRSAQPPRPAPPSRERVRAPRPRDPSRPAHLVKPSEFVNRERRRPARSGPGMALFGVVIALQLFVAALAVVALYVAMWGRGAPVMTASEAPRAAPVLAPRPAKTAARPEAPALAALPSAPDLAAPSAALDAPPAPATPPATAAAPPAPPDSPMPPAPPAASAPAPAAAPPPSASPALAAPPPRIKTADLSFPQPPAYGVYALIDDKLFELQPVRAMPVDPRNAGQLAIREPGRTVVASGKPAFVVFRRDLASHPPEKVPLRIAARVAHAMNFDSTGRAIMTTPTIDTWIIRELGHDLRASPIEGNSDMIKLRVEDPTLSLSPGRYELMIGGQAYDFIVAGEVTDPAHCVEGVTTVRGQVFNECKPVL